MFSQPEFPLVLLLCIAGSTVWNSIYSVVQALAHICFNAYNSLHNRQPSSSLHSASDTQTIIKTLPECKFAGQVA